MPNRPNPVRDWPKFEEATAYKVRGSRLNELKEAILLLVRGDNVRVAGTLTKHATEDGLTISSIYSGKGSVAHPFKILTQVKPDDPDTIQAGIAYNSSLYLSLKPNDKISITGLLSSENPAIDDSGWFDLLPNDAIWLGIVMVDGTPTASIDSWGQADDFDLTADAWTYGPSYVDDDGADPPVFQSARKLIGYSVAGDDGLPVVTQSMKTDQLLRDVVIDGQAAKYPFAHEGGYPI